MTQEPETVELSIQEFSSRGYGVAYIERPTAKPVEVEVAHTLPGDRILIEMRRKMRPPKKGRLLEVLTASQDRVETRCSHARVCGGCCWQQMDYAAQLRIKEKRVSDSFKSAVSPIIPCDSPFEYRNKMEFSFSENRAGAKYLGLMIAQAEPYVFNVDKCHLCKPWFSEVLNEVRSWWEQSGIQAYNPPHDTGTLRYLTLREAVRTGQKMAVLNISGRAEFAPPKAQIEAFVQAVQKTGPISVFLRIHQANKGRPTQFFEMHLAGPDHIVEELHLERGTLKFKISPISFFQPNTLQAEKLYNAALSLIASYQNPVIYDLYCGTGTLGMAAASQASQVIGIELSPEAVLDAEVNAARNNISNISFRQGDVGQVLTQLQGESNFRRPDIAIVDPPRAGLDPLALHHLKILKPKAILYISCNPLTQAANIENLLASGYRLKALQPVDQFPHTYHIENIALLER
ncbi:MAG: 23S rRNA (uracil(1939)-C(5))-methyltransferase RlmD [Verrucomicrobia bacterium]|nr:23S rRNA (uracil(1939)-C(5))-methyltransferase RlmD [Verrucomicrobiota bacterium]